MIAGAAALLAACQAPDTMPPGAVDGFTCPPRGTRVEFVTGERVVEQGGLPGDPSICVRSDAQGRETHLLLNRYVMPLQDAGMVRAGLAPLFPLGLGRSVAFIRLGTTRSRDQYQFLDRWRVTGEGAVLVGGESREAWRVSYVSEGINGNTYRGEWALWADKATGVALKAGLAVTRGTAGGAPFEVSRLVPPAD